MSSDPIGGKPSPRLTYVCASCGDVHELPLAFHAPAPAYWDAEAAKTDPAAWQLNADLCVTPHHQFIHGRLEIPLNGQADTFVWGVWASLSTQSYERTLDLWTTTGREDIEPCHFGWLSTELGGIYGVSTLSLPVDVFTRPIGQRPSIILHPGEHPLAIEQSRGMSVERAGEIASAILHGVPGAN